MIFMKEDEQKTNFGDIVRMAIIIFAIVTLVPLILRGCKGPESGPTTNSIVIQNDKK